MARPFLPTNVTVNPFRRRPASTPLIPTELESPKRLSESRSTFIGTRINDRGLPASGGCACRDCARAPALPSHAQLGRTNALGHRHWVEPHNGYRLRACSNHRIAVI